MEKNTHTKYILLQVSVFIIVLSGINDQESGILFDIFVLYLQCLMGCQSLIGDHFAKADEHLLFDVGGYDVVTKLRNSNSRAFVCKSI